MDNTSKKPGKNLEKEQGVQGGQDIEDESTMHEQGETTGREYDSEADFEKDPDIDVQVDPELEKDLEEE